MKKPHVEFYRSPAICAGGDFHWRLRAPNGRIVASGEGFTSAAKARASFALVARYAPAAVVRG